MIVGNSKNPHNFADMILVWPLIKNSILNTKQQLLYKLWNSFRRSCVYLNGVQGNTEFAVDAGRGHRRVVEGEQAEGRRQRLLPAMASKVDRGHTDWTKLQLSKLCLEARGFRKNRNCDSVSWAVFGNLCASVTVSGTDWNQKAVDGKGN